MSSLWEFPGRVLALERWVPPGHRVFSVALVLGVVGHLLFLVSVRVVRPEPKIEHRRLPQVRMVLPEKRVAALQDAVWSDPATFALPRLSALPKIIRASDDAVALRLGRSIETMLPRELSTEAEGKPLPILAGDWLGMRPWTHAGGSVPVAGSGALAGSKGAFWVEGSLRDRPLLAQPEVPERKTSSPLGPAVIRVVVMPGGEVARALVEQSTGEVEVDRVAQKLVREIRFASKMGSPFELGTVVVYFRQIPSVPVPESSAGGGTP